jgi:two-component system, OmpR family, response regulator VicR
MTPKAKTILIIEDDPNFARFLARLFERIGHRPALCAIPAEVVDLARSHAPDLIMLDVMVDRAGGWHILHKLKNVTPAPIVMMTGAEVDDSMRRDAVLLGARDVLHKPFPSVQLIELLERLT